MFLRLLNIETRKTLKHPALWAGLGTLLLLLALFVFIRHAQISYGYMPPTGGLEQDLLAGLSLFNWIGGFVYAVTASVIAAYDYPDRIIQIWLARGVSRRNLLFARLTVILLFGWTLVCLAVFVTLGLAALSRDLFFGTVDASHLNVVALLPALLRTFWSSLPYLALTVLLAVASRSPLFAAGGMILYADVFEKLLLSLSDRYPALTQYLPGQLALILQINNYALDHTAPRPIFDPHMMTEPHAIATVGIVFLLVSGVAFVIFSHQDLGG